MSRFEKRLKHIDSYNYVWYHDQLAFVEEGVRSGGDADKQYHAPGFGVIMGWCPDFDKTTGIDEVAQVWMVSGPDKGQVREVYACFLMPPEYPFEFEAETPIYL